MEYPCGAMYRQSGGKRSSELLLSRKTLPEHLLKAQITKKLHEILETEDLVKLEQAFLGRTFDKPSLRKFLVEQCNIEFMDDEFSVLFMKINSSGDGEVTWSELTEFLLLGFEEEVHRSEQILLEPPIVSAPKMFKTHHRQAISKICFSPAILPDKTSSWINGCYLTLSKDGCINYWSVEFDLLRTVYSKCTTLKLQQTWVTDMVVMPDISIVCTSSTERDLRFYDTTAKKFELRVIITTLDHPVCTMFYHYNMLKENEESKLILGDQGGNIYIIFINPFQRGPFKSEPGFFLRSTTWAKFVKHPETVPFMRLIEFHNIHQEWVRQVAYYPSLNCFISIANCPKQSMYISDMSQKTIYSFNIACGVYCMDFLDSVHVIVTGSADSLIRVWNTFVPHRPCAILNGHHNAVVAVILLDDEGSKLLSMGKDKCIKVWDLKVQNCLQTYFMLPSDLGERSDFKTHYNPNTREVVICSMKIAVIVVYKKLNPDETDGYTHSSPISTMLYNPLFKFLITCALDSSIITWDPFAGTRLLVIRDAHTKIVCCEMIPVEITAATFNPGLHRLLTGARDGTLKIWDFKTGVCLRNMAIEYNCEVTSVMWVPQRIFAVGWNKHITEFADGGTGNDSKKWETRHSEDVICADASHPQTIVTCSFKGEVIFWRLETGQPYKRFNAAFPNNRCKLTVTKKTENKSPHPPTGSVSSLLSGRASTGSTKTKISHFSHDRRKFGNVTGGEMRLALPNEPITMKALTSRAKKIAWHHQPISQTIPTRGTSVRAIHFLQTRPMVPHVASIALALDSGIIQMYSHHAFGEVLTGFSACHVDNDYVMTMTSDVNDELLFTGHRVGYIKIWIIANYAWGEDRDVFLPKYRIMFPFMWTDVIQCRAKRAVRNQPLPILCSSHKGHVGSIVQICYMDECKIYCSASDLYVRVWSLGGLYLGTLGSFEPWSRLVSFLPPLPRLTFEEPKIPPDIKRTASWTTLKVLNGGNAPRTIKKQPPKPVPEIDADTQEKGIYGKALTFPILGNHFTLPTRTRNVFDVKLDTSLPIIPIYTHLETKSFERPIHRIETPKPQLADVQVKAREVRFQSYKQGRKVSK